MIHLKYLGIGLSFVGVIVGIITLIMLAGVYLGPIIFYTPILLFFSYVMGRLIYGAYTGKDVGFMQ